MCEKNQRAPTRRRLRRKLLMGLAHKDQGVAIAAVAHGGSGLLGFAAQHVYQVHDDPIRPARADSELPMSPKSIAITRCRSRAIYGFATKSRLA